MLAEVSRIEAQGNIAVEVIEDLERETKNSKLATSQYLLVGNHLAPNAILPNSQHMHSNLFFNPSGGIRDCDPQIPDHFSLLLVLCWVSKLDHIT